MSLPVLPRDPADAEIPPEPESSTEIPGLASFPRRATAFSIDFIILSLGLFAVERLVKPVLLAPETQLWAMNYILKAMQGTTAEKLPILGALLGALVLLLIPYDFYFIFFEYWLGATPGKRLLRIRVETLDTSPLTLKQCWVRQLFRHLDFLLVVPAVGGIIFGGRKQRLGDWAAGTLVMDVPNLPPWEMPTRHPPYPPSPDESDHLPQLPRV